MMYGLVIQNVSRSLSKKMNHFFHLSVTADNQRLQEFTFLSSLKDAMGKRPSYKKFQSKLPGHMLKSGTESRVHFRLRAMGMHGHSMQSLKVRALFFFFLKKIIIWSLSFPLDSSRQINGTLVSSYPGRRKAGKVIKKDQESKC